MKIQNVQSSIMESYEKKMKLVSSYKARPYDLISKYGFIWPRKKSNDNPEYNNNEVIELHVYDEQKFLLFLLEHS